MAQLSYLLDVKYILKEGKAEEFVSALEKLGMEEKSLQDKGCRMYRYGTLQKENGQNILRLREIWDDKELQQEHLKQEHFQKFCELKKDYVEQVEVKEHEVYVPKKYAGGSDGMNARVTVPGSKSMTNRALLIAALSEGESVLEGVLFSDDSRHFLGSLRSLGFELDIDEDNKTVRIQGNSGKIPNSTGEIDVGSAGTAARFLTAMLALSSGEYTIHCSKQMEKRPMKPLFDVLTDMGAKFTYLNEEGFLPVRVRGNGGVCKDVDMDISKSTQFLSAMLMVTSVMDNGLNIRIVSEKKTGAYIHITIEMLKEFGIDVDFDGNTYHIRGNQKVKSGKYIIEPDVSAACYFYAAAAITGGSVTVRNVHRNSMQGDMKFLQVLEKMGCTVTDTDEGINVSGRTVCEYDGIDIDMNNFSDQALTLAVVAAFAKTPTYIRNVGHIKGQECDRMYAIVTELGRCGIKAEIQDEDIMIIPGEVKPALIQTYDDHRVAMAFTLLSLRADGIIIDNPMCCKKTFENYYDVFEELTGVQEKIYN